MLKNLHLPGGSAMVVIGAVLFILGFGVSFLVDRISIESRRAFRIALILLGISLALLLSSSILWILKWGEISLVFAYGGVISFCIFAVYFNRNIEGRKLKIRKDRQLASILFTDIKSFTRMMSKDELTTIRALEQNRKIQKRLIRKYRGAWIKEIGDATLSIFYTASEAVLCAVEIQNTVKHEGNFDLKMGIHIAEILFTDDDIFGDGVNIASRISEHADAGEICFSEPVYDNIKNREEIEIMPLGKIEFKNVESAMAIYKITT